MHQTDKMQRLNLFEEADESDLVRSHDEAFRSNVIRTNQGNAGFVDLRTDLVRQSETPHGAHQKYVTHSFRHTTGSVSKDACSVYSSSCHKSVDSRENDMGHATF